jgi:uncharacterized protein
MIIDGHAHAAGEYATVESILALSRKHDIASVVLCTSPKNNRDLKEPPSFPFLKSPRSIFLLNRMLRFGYQSFLKDHGDGNACVFQLATQLPNLVIPFLWVDPLDSQHMDNLEECIHKYHPRGIKLHQAWDPFTINGSEFSQLVEVAQAKNLPIYIQGTKPGSCFNFLIATEM